MNRAKQLRLIHEYWSVQITPMSYWLVYQLNNTLVNSVQVLTKIVNKIEVHYNNQIVNSVSKLTVSTPRCHVASTMVCFKNADHPVSTATPYTESTPEISLNTTRPLNKPTSTIENEPSLLTSTLLSTCQKSQVVSHFYKIQLTLLNHIIFSNFLAKPPLETYTVESVQSKILEITSQ